MEEQWKDIEGFERLYQISNLGRIKSLHKICGQKRMSEQIKKIRTNRGGYCEVLLYKNGICTCSRVHRLVANAFIPNIENKPEVNHINGIKTDNRAENLEWVTASENSRHAILTGLRNDRLLTETQVEDIRYFHNVLGWGSKKLSKYMGITKHLIDHVLYGNCYKLQNAETQNRTAKYGT